MKSPALFDRSARLLDLRSGLANTLILISSSWLVALAISAADDGRIRRAKLLLTGGLAVGSCFAVLKITEYVHKFAAGITPMTNDFFTFYFILTGVHFLHYLIGLVVLSAMIMALHRQGDGTSGHIAWLEAGGIYWHMVDLLWLFLFPMFYLLPVR